MLFQIKSYLKFLWNSKNEHAVHSPFVFNLLTKCFYDGKPNPKYAILKNYRKALLENTNTIEVIDFCAGSKVFNSNTRQICKIAKTAGITQKRAKLLFRITNYLQPDSILEIGSSLGIVTSAMALGNPKATITTLETCPNTANQSHLQLQKFNHKNVVSLVSEFRSYLEKRKTHNHSTEHFKPKTDSFSLIYFNKNQEKIAILDNIDNLLQTVNNETLWIINGIHCSQEMEETWKRIKEHPKVTVTIDTFQWGFVFFRREQPKEHFIIRV